MFTNYMMAIRYMVVLAFCENVKKVLGGASLLKETISAKFDLQEYAVCASTQ